MMLKLKDSALLSVIAAGSLLFATEARAHIRMGAPTGRVAGSEVGPCGEDGSVRSLAPTQLVGGSELTVEWTEVIDHDATYRISLLLDGDAFDVPMSQDDNCDPSLDEWCIADDIPDDVAPGATGNTHAYTFTLPDVSCDNCTLQVIQKSFVNYYQCADIVIVPQDGTVDGAGGSVETSTGGSGVDLGSGGAEAATGGDAALVSGGAASSATGGDSAMPEGSGSTEGDERGADSSGSCAFSPKRAGVSWNYLWVLGALLLRRRRMG